MPAARADAEPAFLAPATGRVVPAGRRPTFSVVVAAWQAAATVGVAVRSALEQTEAPLEVVVCDDGSTDDLAGALAPFGSRVRLLHQAHAGGAAARNTAAEQTTGDFVALLDADDTWSPDRLRRLGDLAAARPDLDLLTTDAWLVVDGRRHGRFGEAGGGFAVHDQPTEILRRDFLFSHLAVRRTTWRRLGGFDEELPRGHDWDFCVRALLSGSRAGCVDEPLADYVLHAASLSADRPRSLRARVDVLDRVDRDLALTPEQRAVLRSSRHTQLARARLAAAEVALIGTSPGRRRSCLELLLSPGVGLRTRLLAAGAVVAPAWAGRRLRQERAVRGRARADRRLPEPASPSAPRPAQSR